MNSDLAQRTRNFYVALNRKKSKFDGKAKSSKFKACKYWGMRRTYRTPQWQKMQRNVEHAVRYFKPKGATVALTWTFYEAINVWCSIFWLPPPFPPLHLIEILYTKGLVISILHIGFFKPLRLSYISTSWKKTARPESFWRYVSVMAVVIMVLKIVDFDERCYSVAIEA